VDFCETSDVEIKCLEWRHQRWDVNVEIRHYLSVSQHSVSIAAVVLFYLSLEYEFCLVGCGLNN